MNSCNIHLSAPQRRQLVHMRVDAQAAAKPRLQNAPRGGDVEHAGLAEHVDVLHVHLRV